MDYSTPEKQERRMAEIVKGYGRNFRAITRLIGGSPRHDLTDYTEADEGMHWSDNPRQ